MVQELDGSRLQQCKKKNLKRKIIQNSGVTHEPGGNSLTNNRGLTEEEEEGREEREGKERPAMGIGTNKREK